ncbi:MAG: hypothetical protein OEW33_03445 [Nitrospirota bacterium]|nr:hypothetical protein [Nitrospirota bacterium]
MFERTVNQGVSREFRFTVVSGIGRRTWRAASCTFTGQWFGAYRPKQYCAFMGKQSMIQHTWKRAKVLCPAQQVVTVMDLSH